MKTLILSFSNNLVNEDSFIPNEKGLTFSCVEVCENKLKEKNIENKIYEIRGVQVMLDSDLARIYKCKNGTKEINQAVNRNINKFPMEFSWILSNEESKDFLVTNCDQKIETRGGRYKNPRVFTEQGVYMLATILKSKAAVNTTIKIIETFVKMRHCIIENQNYLPNRVLLLEEKVDNNTKKINEIFDKFEIKSIKKNQILFEGETYDAYSLLMDILSVSEEEIIIIDNYAGKELLEFIDLVGIVGEPQDMYGAIVKTRLATDKEFKKVFNKNLEKILGNY